MSHSMIELRLLLEGGQSQSLDIAPDSPELARLFHVLGSRSASGAGSDEQFFQLPLDGGKESFSFSSTQLVAISTRPPVLIQFEQQDSAPPPAAQPLIEQIERPHHMVIDDFLGHYEHQDMLAYAMQQADAFDPGTVETGEQQARQNLAILEFAQAAHSRLICNRLLTWLPRILQSFGMAPFPVQQVESQLTASNDGHYYRAHLDADQDRDLRRALTCVYYFSKQPSQFSGGALRIYDAINDGGQRWQADSFQQCESVSNRMVIFPSDSFHELMPIRCPSGKFEDSRFAVTNWIWQQDQPDDALTHGWGHMHCASEPAGRMD